jgi:hypothetical protein
MPIGRGGDGDGDGKSAAFAQVKTKLCRGLLIEQSRGTERLSCGFRFAAFLIGCLMLPRICCGGCFVARARQISG